jgi:long-chain acyl-CoA synthetase
LLERFKADPSATAVVSGHAEYSYGWLTDRVSQMAEQFHANGVAAGAVVALEADFSPAGIAAFIALAGANTIIVPLLRTSAAAIRSTAHTIAKVEFRVLVDADEKVTTQYTAEEANHPYYKELRQKAHPGLVLFTSGSSGKPKAAVHDLAALLDKFHTRRDALRTVNFLQFDHWGGLNTLLHTLSNGGTVFCLRDRTPDYVCHLIERYRIEALPASPTFFNLLLLSRAYERHDLSTLKIVSYGTEPMPQSTLSSLAKAFPWVRLHQTYGLIEVGVLRSKSLSNDSVWLKIGGEGYQTRIVNGLLEIKAHSAMLGYLNAPSPFTADGWFQTGDAVETNGEYLRIIGRASEMINVGGEKVFPQEVESVVLEVENVADVLVYGRPNALLGNIVCADVSLEAPEDEVTVDRRIERYCRLRLAAYKVPLRIRVVDEVELSERLKKVRSPAAQ